MQHKETQRCSKYHHMRTHPAHHLKDKVDESWKGGHYEPVDPATDPDLKAMVETAKEANWMTKSEFPHMPFAFGYAGAKEP